MLIPGAAAATVGVCSKPHRDLHRPEAEPASAAVKALGCGGRKRRHEDFSRPAKLEVAAGTRVTWANKDSAPHTATASSDAQRSVFDTKVLKEGQSGDIAFDKPGTYAYICDLHPFMKATLEVK